MNEDGGKAAALLVERHGHVMVLTINRPQALNAIDPTVAGLLGAAVEEATTDDSVWVVVITGAGGRAFSAGADLKAMTSNVTIVAAGHEEWGFAGFVHHFTPKPVIAAVEGYALGGGLEICLACDLVVAGTTARFGLPEVRRGLIPGGGGLIRLPEQIPFRRALQLIFTGEEFDADEAIALGLVNEVVEAGTAVEHALALARRICDNAPLAVQSSKRVASRSSHRGTEQWAASREERRLVAATEDAEEGVTAFVEKRKPDWKGR